MSIPKPDDPYGMAAPPAWPEADEDVLETLSQTFENAASTVRAQSESAQHEQAMMFAGAALWSGGAAGAAHGVLGQRIIELHDLATRLQAAGDLLHNCSEAVKDAKQQISTNVENANNDIASVNGDKDMADDDKKDYVKQKIQNTKNANLSLIRAEAEFVAGKQPKPDAAHYEMKRDRGTPALDAPALNLVAGERPGVPEPPAPANNSDQNLFALNQLKPAEQSPLPGPQEPSMPANDGDGAPLAPSPLRNPTPQPAVQGPEGPALPANNGGTPVETNPIKLPTSGPEVPQSPLPPGRGVPVPSGPISPAYAAGAPAPGAWPLRREPETGPTAGPGAPRASSR